ncbi:MAG: histone deacetylase family protein [Acetobacteraceae bacterium]|nr:histone deacetylase family protein [Acetobacteraceae bacterium]
MDVFWDDVQLQHTPGFFLQRGLVRQNFEVPARALSLLEGIAALGLTPRPPPALPPDALRTVHADAYLAFLQTAHAEWSRLPGAGPEVVANVHPSPEMLSHGAQPGIAVVGQAGWFSADAACPIGPHTWDAACAAAACSLAAAEAAAAGRSAYALVRPPGHHAYPARAGGHCYLNNAALAAERLRAAGAARVAILDIDSHHGNGTQGTFWTRQDVLFCSLHGDPGGYYPWYVGHAAERGAGEGEGFNLNLPLPRGSSDAPWLAALDNALSAITHFAPDALVVSLGFDASEHEPLKYLSVTADGFARAGERIGALRLPTALIQEGGYDQERLGQLLARFLAAFGSASAA